VTQRIFARKRDALVPVTANPASYRLTNAPVMVGLMCAAADADIFGQIEAVVRDERAKRSR
jgi:hypothetical protein